MLKSLSGIVLGICCGFSLGCDAYSSAPEQRVAAPGASAIEEQASLQPDQAHPSQRDAVQEIAYALAQLTPEEHQLASAQRFCAVINTNPLGSMGTPLKLDINGESVFLCCAGCQGKARRDPEATLASAAKLAADNSTAP